MSKKFKLNDKQDLSSYYCYPNPYIEKHDPPFVCSKVLENLRITINELLETKANRPLLELKIEEFKMFKEHLDQELEYYLLNLNKE